MSLARALVTVVTGSFPRVSGDEPVLTLTRDMSV